MGSVFRIADNIISPLGRTTAENFQAMKAGQSALRHYDSYSGRLEDDYVASRFTYTERQQLMVGGLTWFESLIYHSVSEALSQCSIDIGSKRVLFVVSTTKANVEYLGSEDYETMLPVESAQRIADRLGIKTQPIVVCNACISGVAAIITAQRLLSAGSYDYAVVTGCDVMSHFVVSGFQSLKALSPEPCRPFDIERLGLNLGEAAATMIMVNSEEGIVKGEEEWRIVDGAIRNDGYHISSPSPKGEGCASAIRYVTGGNEEARGERRVDAVNVHGTATMYNDQMESKAIEASGLSEVPINTLKGYLGHTLGASGILETIITMLSVSEGELVGSRGFSEAGVSGKVRISSEPMGVGRNGFVKVISGFGGCNAAIYMHREHRGDREHREAGIEIVHSVRITPEGVIIDGNPLDVAKEGGSMLTGIYKRYIGSYPKYFKMDGLSRLGFVASELLLAQEQPRRRNCADRAVVVFNHSSSTRTDCEYAKSIVVGDNYFPSPSLFVYTLPNIVCGEIAIRNGYHGETSFYILGYKDEKLMNDVIRSTFRDRSLKSIVAGWIDYRGEEDFEAEMGIVMSDK